MADRGSPARPAPILTDDNHVYWDSAKGGRLVAQRCSRCGRLRHPPRPMCPNCHSLDYALEDLAGSGVVYSYSLLHHPQHPSFTYPVIAVLVELNEGIRVVSNLIDVEPDRVHIGMPVHVRFAPTRDDMAVPVFAPAKAEQ